MKKFSILLISILFLSCIFSSIGLCEEREFNNPFNTIWYSVVEALIKAGDTISTIDKESGVIVIKKEGRKLSESDLRKVVNSLPSDVEWQSAKAEANILVNPLSDETTKVIIIFKITGVGMPYKLEKIDGKYKRVATDFLSHEYLLYSNGRIERSYFRLIEQVLLKKNE